MTFELNEAQTAAQREVDKIIEADAELTQSEVEKVRLVREDDLIWTFAADVPKLIEAGWIPGAITVIVAKEDGHILTAEEEEILYKNREATRRRIGFR